jgi:mRNA interferase MazF
VKRGDLVVAAAAGDCGKPRPYLVIQSDAFPLESVSLCPLATEIKEISEVRVLVAADEANGLREDSLIMVDKIVTVRRDRVSRQIGCISDETRLALDRALMVFFDLT